MTRDELRIVIHDELKRLERLFEEKNRSYGMEKDGFYNFSETARRVFGTGDLMHAFAVLRILADKHWVALANNGLDDPEADQRLRDIAVYALIGLAMWWEMNRKDEAGR